MKSVKKKRVYLKPRSIKGLDSFIKKHPHIKPIFFASLVALVGVATLFATKAATPTASIQPESGTISSPATNVSNSSASGGRLVKFNAATTPPTNDVQPPIAADSGKTWRSTFSEDFDGTTLNLAKMTPCWSWAGSYEGCTEGFNAGAKEVYRPSQVRLSGGTAKLVAEPATGLSSGRRYKSGMVATTNTPGGNWQSPLYKFKYGYLEARLKTPPQNGFMTAFWLVEPSNPANGYPYAYEIDVLESLSGENISHMHVHYNNRGSSWTPNRGNNGSCPAFNPSQAFHTYGIDWKPTYIAFYIDGKECGRFTSSTGNIWAGDLVPQINLMVDTNWNRDAGVPLNDFTQVGTLEVDYMKVWQQQ